MLWVLSAVIGLLVGAAGAWIIQTSARSKEADQARKECQTLQEQLNVAGADLKVAQARVEMLEKSLEEQKESRKAEAEAMRREYDEKLQKMVLTFKESASSILKEKSGDLSAANLGKKMEEFRRAVEDSREKSLKNTATLEQQIRSMMEQTAAVGRQADNLATALRSNNKAVGNWGEVVLLNLLEGMGLREGEDYVKQETIKDVDGNAVLSDDGGRRLIPDVVLYLPENKAVVIDSKVSLEGYIAYVNAADETERGIALAAHSKSVDAHVRELSSKSYSRYIRSTGRDSLDYVVMFVPNEGAFQLYYQNFREKWHEAFDRGIIIAGESNLFAMLKKVRRCPEGPFRTEKFSGGYGPQAGEEGYTGQRLLPLSTDRGSRGGGYMHHTGEHGKIVDNENNKTQNAAPSGHHSGAGGILRRQPAAGRQQVPFCGGGTAGTEGEHGPGRRHRNFSGRADGH